jgi:uncharacterized protein
MRYPLNVRRPAALFNSLFLRVRLSIGLAAALSASAFAPTALASSLAAGADASPVNLISAASYAAASVDSKSSQVSAVSAASDLELESRVSADSYSAVSALPASLSQSSSAAVSSAALVATASVASQASAGAELALAGEPELSSQAASSVAASVVSDAGSSSLAAASVAATDAAVVQISAAASSAAVVETAKTESLVVLDATKTILGAEVKPGMSVRLTWSSESVMGGFSEETPVLVINGAKPGKTLCLTAAVHGDELNGIEMIRRVIYGVNPEKLTGTLIAVPVANIMGFRRNSRYLPDRRDWNRYFPGNTRGSAASRLAHSFFTKIIWHCDALVDIHTGSFHRTNLPQLRADLSNDKVVRLAQNFGAVAVLNTRGNPSSLRAAAVKAGVPTVTLEAGEPMAVQREIVAEGTAAINELLANLGMYGKQRKWNRIAPVYYKSVWVRANQSGILFSSVGLGDRVREGEILGTVTDPVTNARSRIVSPYQGRVLGMALDQVVLPGFAAYHIGIQTPEAILIEESQLNNGSAEEDEEDGDDAGVEPSESEQEAVKDESSDE